MQIDEHQHGAVKVLKPHGALIAADAPAFKRRVQESSAATLGRFIIDLSGTPYADSAGLEALVDISEEMARAGQVLRLCCANRTVREVLDLTDLAPLFDLYEDTTAAVRSFL